MDKQHLDSKRALEKLGGSYRLLKILLIGFIVKHSRIDEEIEALSNINNYEEAERIAHSIKGLSANLCADQLNELAYILEKAYESHSNDYHKAFDDFKVELHAVIEEIKVLLKAMEDAKEEVAIAREDKIPYEVEGINLLIEALDSFHYERISKAFDIFKHYEFTDECNNLTLEIIKYIEDYDYNGAKEALNILLEDVLSGGKDGTMGRS